MSWIFVRIASMFLEVFNSCIINCHFLSESFVPVEITIIMNFVVVSSVGIKRADCAYPIL